MENKSLNCNKQSQYNEKSVNLLNCETYKKIDVSINMCSYLPDCNTYDVSFSSCEVEKKINVNAQVSCSPFHCSYIDSLISSANYCISDEGCYNCCDSPISNDGASLALPCQPIEDIFIDLPECPKDEENSSNSIELTSNVSVSEEDKKSYSVTTDDNTITTDNTEIVEDLSVANLSHKKKRKKEGINMKPNSHLILAVLTNLIDMFLKNCSKEEIIQNESNLIIKDESDTTDKPIKGHRHHRHDRHRKHRSHHRHSKQNNLIKYNINDVIIISIFELMRRLNE
ncbi:hypothetical protein N4T77_11725 [Clostridium sp. CX1]|uniref:hypothetical protein n=1 Tax=Clostridium sp. CX1 TaxID=2978346 RepID=UPI0021BEDD97|nr:hypothetical protein [Clostridium sp. CX1]MCT8977273.1 hypothetical protein [Clostridium sp. CX1]